jgi:dTDP-4-amino-4,6-dideoxygalactose transaminase
MKIPILDLKAQYHEIKEEVDAAIKKVVDAQAFVLGEESLALESEMAKYCGVKYAVGVASGTDALILCLKALGIGPGDEVITTPFTFIATAEAVSLVGARPAFVDIDRRTYNIDPALIEKRINKNTKAVIPVHLYGQCADMDPISQVAKRCGLKLIEDCAQAIGATYKGKKAGSMSDAGCLSFFPSKNLGAFGDGGMVVTNDKDIADSIRMLRVHGSSERYIHSAIGTNSRLDNLQASIIRVKLKYLDGWLKKRADNARYYNKRLEDLPCETPYVPDYNIHTYHLYTLRTPKNKDKVMEFLNKNGIETRTYYPVPLHLQECYKAMGYKKGGDLKEAESAASSAFSVAVYPEMTKQQMDYVINMIKKAFA